MAWILNKKTGVLTEITDKDAIKTCKKYPNEYEVSESLEMATSNNDDEEQATKPLSKMNIEELKEHATKNEIEVDGLTKSEILQVLKEAGV